ncbi:ATP-binding protein [Candidatus Saccharibacteria bacterium]|nr:ATP-binding protein [Candidatus Saccharibacteria bacterium]
MSKLITNKPVLMMLYGFPGSGKTYLAKQLCDTLQAAHVSSDRIRGELFEKPRYDKAEDEIVEHLMLYMTQEFLDAGVSVVFDTNASRFAERRTLRELAQKHHAKPLLVWLQIDQETAFGRISKRDKRKKDEKYARPFDRTGFEAYVGRMQNPKQDEDYIVLSGKHSFPMQRSTLIKKLYDLGLITAEHVSAHVVKPGLVNLIPGMDGAKRNITIR